MEFDLKLTIRRLLSSVNESNRGDRGDKNIFDVLFNEMERYHRREVRSIADLKARDNKKVKGDLWEQFCHLYLSSLETKNGNKRYKIVWFWKKVPTDFFTKVFPVLSDTSCEGNFGKEAVVVVHLRLFKLK